jgi:hypothetical protein
VPIRFLVFMSATKFDRTSANMNHQFPNSPGKQVSCHSENRTFSALRAGCVGRAACALFLLFLGDPFVNYAVVSKLPSGEFPHVSRSLSVIGSSDEETAPAKSTVATEPVQAAGSELPPSDFPTPASIKCDEEFTWDADGDFVDNAVALGQRLGAVDDIFRQPGYGAGLMLASSIANIAPMPIVTGKRLAPIIADRLRLRVIRDGKQKGSLIPVGQLNTLLGCEAFLQQFRPVDRATEIPIYLPNYELTKPGYNDGGMGCRILYVGEAPMIKEDTAAMQRFLDEMAFASNADKTNAVAAAITVMLRNFFPGGKPLINVTGNKSHCGKDTVILFAAGRGRITAISYQSTDWALERSFVGAVKHSPDTALVNIENARLGHKDKFIASGFLERFLCDPEPTLFSTGTGAPVRRKNDLAIAASTNFGELSTDLLNRSLPIHLEMIGSVADRKSAIGNPKYEYLPRYYHEIEAELRSMIHRWKEAGCPPDTDIKHPFSEWASTVGGILMVNGFDDFLANFSLRRTVDDPRRKALALLGGARPDEWLSPSDWADLAVDVGVVDRVIPRGDQTSDKGRERGIGVVFSAHRDETFHGETECERLTLRLDRARRRFENGQPSTRYRFCVTDRAQIPIDPEQVEDAATA